MISLKRVWLCCRLNVSKWIVSPRIYAVFFFSLIYIYGSCIRYNYSIAIL